jgi:hypothetical protein
VSLLNRTNCRGSGLVIGPRGGRSHEPWIQRVSLLRVLRSLRQALDRHLPGTEWGDLPVVGLEWEEWEGHGGVVFYPVATPSNGQLDHDDLSTIAGLQMRSGAASENGAVYRRVWTGLRRVIRVRWRRGGAGEPAGGVAVGGARCLPTGQRRGPGQWLMRLMTPFRSGKRVSGGCVAGDAAGTECEAV